MEIELGGANAAVFPALTTWGWEIALYLFLGGVVAGMMMLSGTFRLARRDAFPQALKIADVAALPILGVGLLLLIVDLSQVQNVWRLYTTFQVTSPMSWGAWILLLAMVVLALWFVSRLAPIAPERFWIRASGKKAALRGVRALVLTVWGLTVAVGAWARRRTRLLAVATVILGVCLGFYTGLLLSTISARPLWNTAALAPLFLVSGLASGGAFLCLFLPRDEHERLAPVSVAACAVELAILLAFALTLATGTAAAQRAIGILTGGTLGVVFLGIAIGLGLLIPVVVESFEVLHRRLAFVPARLPPVLKLGGGVALRLAIVYAGMLSFV
jgi:formate-dependent nitrite reductase membrane component NrfD